MTDWFRNYHHLFYFLAGQAFAILAAVLSITAYMVRLETRVVTLETRGSPHLAVIDNRLTVLESQTESNKARLERLIDKATK
jgi:hypothetical protein